MIVFNGLKGAEFFLYNYLVNANLAEPVSLWKAANATCYSYESMRLAARRLEDYGMVKRYRDKNGVPYVYKLNGVHKL